MFKYRPRLKIYADDKKKLIYHPNTQQGFSYGWYKICGLIDDRFYLNTFSYSVTTSQHVKTLRDFFDKRDVMYISIEAPRGLENRSAIRNHYIYICMQKHW